jgi:hypothetical protein
MDRKTLEFSHLQVLPSKKGRLLQKNRGPTEIILNFFLCFQVLWGFFPSQAVEFQGQAAIQSLQKKSCPKTDGRFSVCSGMCHNRRMKVENNNSQTRRQAEKWRLEDFPLFCFCPHFSAFSGSGGRCRLGGGP